MLEILKIQKELETTLENCKIITDEPLKKHTTFKVGGCADIIIYPQRYEDIITIIEICKKNNVDFYVLGNGSNVLVKDGGFRGVIIKTTELNNIEVDGEYIYAECGAELKDVSKLCTEKALSGFEFACGIPGSIGGAIAMNAGAYDGEMKDVVCECIVIDKDMNIVTLDNESLELSYRNSVIQRDGLIALKLKIKLEKAENKTIEDKVTDFTQKRESKQPLEYGSVGSIFKRSPGHYTGKLIQDSGLKGYEIGGAKISEKHAGFIINKNGATAKDILNLIEHIQKTVKENFDVSLEPEVRIIGED